MTISPTMMRDGSTTPAIQGSKWTSISCRPRKYQGALEGFGVLVGFAGSSIGASTVKLHTMSTRSRMQPAMNSARTRYGQVWTLSGRSAAGSAARARPDWTLTSSWSWMVPGWMFSAIEVDPSLEGTADSAVFADAPEVQDHQDRGDDGDEDSVQAVAGEQGQSEHDRFLRQQRTRVGARAHHQQLTERSFGAKQRSGARHVGAHRHRPDRQLVPRQQVAGERQQERERQ